MKITWIGQGGFMIDGADGRLVVDPYLSDALAAKEGLPRLYPPPVTPVELRAEMIICTHNHADHCDLETLAPLMALEQPPMIAGPEPVVEAVVAAGWREELTTALEPGSTLSVAGLEITAVRALHGECPAVGLLVHDASGTLYISGDSEYDPALAEQVLAVADPRPQAAIVCINGRWGNMNAADAARLVDQLGVSVAIPMHYDLFARNSADPRSFTEACAALGLRGLTLKVGQPVSLAGLLGAAGG